MLFRHHWLIRSTTFTTAKRHTSSSQRPPLNILFCGADNFSLPSLQSLHSLSQQAESPITSLTVLCRPDKYTGRNNKTLSSPPIKAAAQSLNLPVLQIDTFTGWTPPLPIDLIVTVSFGLLVPGRLLNNARWGGVNVHPSLLPDLRGPAPIQRALLEGRRQTGVSLQTMHPERFDAGKVLDRRKAMVPEHAKVEDMIKVLGPLGADMLSRWVGSTMPDGARQVDMSPVDEPLKSSYAPKITKETSRVDWTTWTAEKVLRYDRVLGNLWDTTTFSDCFPAKGEKRVTFHGPWKVFEAEECTPILAPGPSVNLFRVPGDKGLRLGHRTADGSVVIPASATIEGEKRGKGLPKLEQGLRERLEGGG